MDKLQQYRQPLVTATGIFLGFMLNFANSWIPDAFTKYKFRDAVIALSTISSIALLVIVLYRILRMDYPEIGIEKFYKRTLRLFIIGISIPFLSMVVVMLKKIVENVFYNT